MRLEPSNLGRFKVHLGDIKGVILAFRRFVSIILSKRVLAACGFTLGGRIDTA
jgi:hypothetical protein